MISVLHNESGRLSLSGSVEYTDEASLSEMLNSLSADSCIELDCSDLEIESHRGIGIFAWFVRTIDTTCQLTIVSRSNSVKTCMTAHPELFGLVKEKSGRL